MNYVDILKRALKITWRNRALWVFGILLALTTGGGGGGGGGGNVTVPGGSGEQWDVPIFRSFQPDFTLPTWSAIAGIIVIVLIVIAILVVIATIIRYLSENALIKMVDQVEATGNAGTVGQGFRKGWSRPAFYMFVIDLVIGIPTAIAAIVLILFGLSPLLLLLLDVTGVTVLAIVLTIGLMLLVIGVIIVAAIALSLLSKLAFREVALGNKRIFEAIGDAYRLIRRNLSDVGMIWLLMLAVGIGWGLLMIPVFIVVLVFAGVLGGVPAAIVLALTESVGATAAVGAPIFLLAMIAPLAFLGGIYAVFTSSVWTLTYRELLAKEAGLLQAGDLAVADAPVPDTV